MPGLYSDVAVLRTRQEYYFQAIPQPKKQFIMRNSEFVSHAIPAKPVFLAGLVEPQFRRWKETMQTIDGTATIQGKFVSGL